MYYHLSSRCAFSLATAAYCAPIVRANETAIFCYCYDVDFDFMLLLIQCVL